MDFYESDVDDVLKPRGWLGDFRDDSGGRRELLETLPFARRER